MIDDTELYDSIDVLGKFTSDFFTSLPDLTDSRGRKYEQSTILSLVYLGMLLGGDDLVNIELILKEYEDILKEVFEIDELPDHNTMGRRLADINPERFSDAFTEWAYKLLGENGENHLVIDGKVLRASGLVSLGEPNPTIVNMIDTKTRLCLLGLYVKRKKSEMSVAPKAIKKLSVFKKIIGGDAAMSTPQIRKEIKNGKGYYILPAKSNRGKLSREILAVFEEINELLWTEEHLKYICPPGTQLVKFFNDEDYSWFETMERGHGREEYRKYELLTDLSRVELEENTDIKAIGLVKRWTKRATTTKKQRKKHGAYKESRTITPFILNIKPTIEEFSDLVRAEWGVENNLHYTLDMCLQEDRSTIRDPDLRYNMAIMRRIVYNSINFLDPHYKTSFKEKRNHLTHNFYLALRMVIGEKSEIWKMKIAASAGKEMIKKIGRDLGIPSDQLPVLYKTILEQY